MKTDRYTAYYGLILAAVLAVPAAGYAAGSAVYPDAEPIPHSNLTPAGLTALLLTLSAVVGGMFATCRVAEAAQQARYVPPPVVTMVVAALADPAYGWFVDPDDARYDVVRSADRRVGVYVNNYSGVPSHLVVEAVINHYPTTRDDDRLLTPLVAPLLAAHRQKTATDQVARLAATLAAARAAGTRKEG